MLNFLPICSILKDKQGIEFGGPTELFSLPKHGMPLYDHVYLDGGNIIKENYFQTDLGSNFLYGEKLGKQFDVDLYLTTKTSRDTFEEAKQVVNRYMEMLP